MNVYQTIADAVIALLKTNYSDMDVMMEEIAHTNGSEDSINDNYFFVALLPVPAITISQNQTQYTILIDIAAHLKSESNKAYLKLSYNLDKVIRPVLCFEDRAITIPSGDSKIVDKVLHYSFTVSFIDGDEPESQPYMENLNLTERI